jgi:hypothetical protein
MTPLIICTVVFWVRRWGGKHPGFSDHREADAANGTAVADAQFCERLRHCFTQPVLRERETINSWAEWHADQRALKQEGSWRDHDCMGGAMEASGRRAGVTTPLSPARGEAAMYTSGSMSRAAGKAKKGGGRAGAPAAPASAAAAGPSRAQLAMDEPDRMEAGTLYQHGAGSQA